MNQDLRADVEDALYKAQDLVTELRRILHNFGPEKEDEPVQSVNDMIKASVETLYQWIHLRTETELHRYREKWGIDKKDPLLSAGGGGGKGEVIIRGFPSIGVTLMGGGGGGGLSGAFGSGHFLDKYGNFR